MYIPAMSAIPFSVAKIVQTGKKSKFIRFLDNIGCLCG
jgi:hypothetical protein